MRREQHRNSAEQLDPVLYGLLVSRVALLHPEGETFDLSRAIGEAAQALQQLAADPKKSFGELVRERRRERGLPIPPAAKVLPFVRPELLAEQVRELDANLPLAVAQQRLQEAHAALEAGHLHQVKPREQLLLEQAYARARHHDETLLMGCSHTLVEEVNKARLP